MQVMQACSDCLDECRFVRRLRGPLFHEEILFLQALDTIDPWTAPQKASVPVCGMYLDELQLLDHPGAKEMRASSLPTQAELGWGIRFVSELTSCAAVLTDGLDLCRRDVEEF